MDTFFDELSLCKTKPVVLSVVQPYADSYVLSSRRICPKSLMQNI